MTLTLTLPLPPPAEYLFLEIPGRGRVKTHEHRVWLAGAMAALSKAATADGFPKFGERVHLHLSVPQTMTGADRDYLPAVKNFLVEPSGLLDEVEQAAITTVLPHPLIPLACCRVTISDAPAFDMENDDAACRSKDRARERIAGRWLFAG